MEIHVSLEIICIGNELLDGRIQETNGHKLGQRAARFAHQLSRILIVPDDELAIEDALASSQADFVVVSGGLGPTSDDITRDVAARFAGVALQEDARARELLESRFNERGYELTLNNLRQCLFPIGAQILYSEVGTAAGFSFEHGQKRFYFFPGVPREFEWFCERFLKWESTDQHSRQLYFFGRGESHLADDLTGIEKLPVRVGYRASYPIIEVKISGSIEAVDDAARFILRKVGRWMVAEDDESLDARVGRLLKANGETVSTAESCTAGGIGAALTRASGSSAWFHQGFITYSNDAKVRALGVLPQTLEFHGAVSPAVACQMALGAKIAAESTYALSVSGIAGPTGGSPEKPVGTVHFALATPHGVWHRHRVFRSQSRSLIREATEIAALAFLLHALEGRLGDADTNGPFQPDDVMCNQGPDIQ